MNDEPILAAGAVLWRPRAQGPEVLLVHRPRYDDWSLPKGKREPGEHLLSTAVRETLEETCIRPVLGPPVRTVSYLAGGLPKEVSYWAAVTEEEAKASHEVDKIAWLPLDQAGGRLSYPHERDVLAALVPRSTVPLIIVRHASAGPKRGDDVRRPLDAKGKKDAAALAALLTCFAPRARVLTSSALRCVQTVQNYAAVAGVSIEERSEFERTYVGPTSARLISDLVEAAQPAIVCLHRENVPAVLGVACAALGADPPADPGLPKGAFWVLHAVPATGGAGGGAGGEAGRLAALEYHRPGATGR
jgi:8-oxo-dGTP diphosphatase